MRTAFFIITLLIGTILQAGNITDCISLGQLHIKPDFLLILLVYFAAVSEPVSAAVISFVIGFTADTILLPMGPMMISCLLTGAFISNLKKLPLADNTVFQAALVFFGCVAAMGFAEFLKFISGKPLSVHLVIRIFSIAGYSAILSPFIWYFLEKLRQITGLKKQR